MWYIEVQNGKRLGEDHGDRTEKSIKIMVDFLSSNLVFLLWFHAHTRDYQKFGLSFPLLLKIELFQEEKEELTKLAKGKKDIYLFV